MNRANSQIMQKKETAGFSPRSIILFAKEHNILKYICVYTGDFFAGKSIEEIVNDAWPLRNLDRQYYDCINLTKDIFKEIKKSEVISSDTYNRFLIIYATFKDLNMCDPFLPDVFLNSWPRIKVEQLFRDIARELIMKNSKKLKRL